MMPRRANGKKIVERLQPRSVSMGTASTLSPKNWTPRKMKLPLKPAATIAQP